LDNKVFNEQCELPILLYLAKRVHKL